jgi:GNAT superfamily N-acetyltransferase
MEDGKFYTMRYSFVSPLNKAGEARYITHFKVELTIDDEFGNPSETIGKGNIQIVLLALAKNNHFDLFRIFDVDRDIFRVASEIYDFTNQEFNSDILFFFDDMLICRDLCIIHQLELLPQYRRKGLGKKMVKDIVNRFGSACDLFVAETFPLQFENDSFLPKDDWYQKMRFDLLDKDFEKSDYLLKAFYQSVGFQYIENYTDLMFLNSVKINEKLNKIELE